MGISHTTKKMALPLMFLVAVIVSLLPTQIAHASGETYYQTSSTTIIGQGGSYATTDNVFRPVTGTGTLDSQPTKQVVGSLTFTKDNSGKFVSSAIEGQSTKVGNGIGCVMTLTISLSGTSGTLSATPTSNNLLAAKDCLAATNLATTFSVTTFNDQVSCVKAGGSWVQGAGSTDLGANAHYTCTGLTNLGAQCFLNGGTYTYEGGGEGNSHMSDGADWACEGSTTTVTQYSKYTSESDCSTGGGKWSNPGGDGTCGPPDASVVQDTTPTCEADWQNPVSWVMCAIYNGMAGISDWLINHAITPLLKVAPISTSSSDTTYKVWSSFRVYANILLVIALLVIVFGQIIGGGVMDAYSVRRALPRILAAAILINLSIYIVAVLVDVTNVIGQGLMSFMEAPLASTPGAFSFHVSGSETAGSMAIGGVTSAAGVGGITLLIVGGLDLAAPALAFVGLFVLLPAVLGLLAAFLTLMLRLAIITALVLVAPVAFALWCLPNTEKYFKKWWSTLLNMLMAYPLIVALFAVCDIMSVTTAQNGGNPLGGLIAFILQFLPLVLVPFAFKISGGALSAISGTLSGLGKRATEAIKGNPNNPNSLRNMTKRNAGAAITRTRANIVRGNENSRSRYRRGIARVAGLGDVMSSEAAVNAEGIKRGEQVKSTGDDRYGRALTSVPLYLDKDDKRTTEASDAQGNPYRRATDKDGNLLRESLAGKEVTEQQYRKAKTLYRTNGEKQYWMDYEAGKINSGDTERYKANYLKWANQEGFSDSEVQGVYTGVAFAKQNDFLNLKYTGLQKVGGKWQFMDVAAPEMNFKPETEERGRNDNLVDDLFYKKGPYQTGLLSAEDMHRVYDIKDHYAKTIRGLRTKELNGTITKSETATLKNTREHLERINSLETTWSGEGRGGRAPQSRTPQTVDEQGVPIGAYSGLSSGNQGVQDEFKKLAYDESGQLKRIDVQTGERITPSGGGQFPSGGNDRQSPPGGTPSPQQSPSTSRRSTREQGAPTTWTQVIPHDSGPSAPVPNVSSDESGSRRAIREQGPVTPPTTGGTATMGATSGPAGAVSPSGTRRAIRPQGAPGDSSTPRPMPPDTLITPTTPNGPVNLPPRSYELGQNPALPTDLPDSLNNGGNDNPPGSPDSRP